jgi:hypothetical protein
VTNIGTKKIGLYLSIRKVRPGLLVYFDLERAIGSEVSEILKIAYCCQSGFGISNIIPKPNLSETVLGKEFNRNYLREGHDALYDSRLLKRMVEKYCREISDVDLMIDSFMIDSNSIRNQVKLNLPSSKSRKKRRDQSQYYTFHLCEVCAM